MTVEATYRCFAEAITRPGQVYHQVGESELVGAEGNEDGSPQSLRQIAETWVDPANDVARTHFSMVPAYEEYEQKSVQTGGVIYTVRGGPEGEPTSSKEQAQTCYEASIEPTVLGCPAGPENGYSVESGEYAGGETVVMVIDTSVEGSDESTTSTTRLHLDAGTYLPVAAVTVGQTDSGEVTDFEHTTLYQTDFVNADSLPNDFFEPASIGWVEPNPEDGLENLGDVTVYWLGTDYPGTDDYPALALFSTYVSPDVEDVNGVGLYNVSIDYRLASEEFARSPQLELQIWDLDDWNELGIQSVQSGCVREEEVQGDDRTVAVFKCGANYLAAVFIDDSVVRIEPRTPGCPEGESCPENPYNFAEAMTLVGADLHLRE
jgi:hypothetical protein